MKPNGEDKVRKELEKLPEGTDVVRFGVPDELADDVLPAYGARLPTGEVVFFVEFDNHEEWKAFQKTRKLVLMFPLGEVPPWFIGAYNEEGNSPQPVREPFDQN